MAKVSALKAEFSISYLDDKSEYVEGDGEIGSLAAAKASADEFLVTAPYGTYALIFKSVLRVDQNMTTNATPIK